MQKPFEIVFWVRVALGVLTGMLAGLLGFVSPNPQAYLGIFVAIAVYILSVVFARTMAGNVQKTERNKLFTAGLGGYIMLFLFAWVLYNTLILAK
jgi:hypothetical protein